jgi:hypothetical protein
MPILKPPKGIQLNRSNRLARGLVGCWLFNENTGGKVLDLSGNGNHGTLQGDAHFVPGKYGSCLDFDGNGDYVKADSICSYLVNSDFTISGWFKWKTSPGNYPTISAISQGAVGNYGNRLTIVLYDNDGGKLGIYDGSAHKGTTDYRDRIWHHFAVTHYDSANKMIGYIDSFIEIAEFSDNVTPLSTDLFSIGQEWDPGPVTSDFWNGQIDNVMIYNRALSAEEIQQLYREPFCMFERGLSPAILYVPAGGAVELSGSIDASTATTATVKIDKKVTTSCACAAEVSASLKLSRKLAAELQSLANLIGSLTLAGEVGLAGTINAALSINGKLSLVTAGKWFTGSLKTERKWLIDALFAGMTANAIKLGTVLSSGWFWMRRLECSVLYRGLSMDTVDFANILTVAENNDNAISPPDYISHNAGSSYFYVVRRFNGCGYQECTLAAAIKIVINIDGELIEPQPNKVFACIAKQISDNKVQLFWFYCPIEQKSQPTRFNIYCDNKTGQIDYQKPLTTIPYRGRRFYSFGSDMLETGKYLFAVRPMDAEQVENDSLARISIQIGAAGPDTIDILNAETT